MSMRILSVPQSPAVFGSVSLSHTAAAGSGSQAESADRDTYTSWEALWGSMSLTETVNENGTAIKAMDGSVNMVNPERAGWAAFSVSAAFQPGAYEPGDLKKTVEMLAAACKITAAAVRCAASGESIFRESKELDRLTLAYQERKTEVSDSFSRMVGGYLESRSRTGGEEQKVRDSVQALFTAYEDKYQAVMEKNPQTAWMGESLFASVMNLQRLGASFQMDGGGAKGLYSLQELEFFAARVCSGFSVNG